MKLSILLFLLVVQALGKPTEKTHPNTCEAKDDIAHQFHFDKSLFETAKSWNHRVELAKNQLISCIKCFAEGNETTFEIVDGGLGHNFVKLHIVKACQLVVWNKIPPPREDFLGKCDKKMTVLSKLYIYADSVYGSTFPSYTPAIGCIECDGNYKILSGGLGQHSISIKSYDGCHCFVYGNTP